MLLVHKLLNILEDGEGFGMSVVRETVEGSVPDRFEIAGSSKGGVVRVLFFVVVSCSEGLVAVVGIRDW